MVLRRRRRFSPSPSGLLGLVGLLGFLAALAGAGAAAATVCPNPPLPAVTDYCGATVGDANLLLRGTVLAGSDVLENGHLLIDAAGTIVCAACDCSAAAGFPTATRVDCPDAVFAPGRINANDFLNYAHNEPGTWGDERYEHRHDWRLGQNGHNQIPATGGATMAEQRWGELRQVLGGATAMRGSTSVLGLVRNLDTTAAATEGLANPPWADDNFPLQDVSGERLDGSCAYPALNSALWLNVAEGIDATARNEFVCLSDPDGSAGGIDTIDDALVVDAIALTAGDVAELDPANATVVWSPRSNLALYGRTAPVTQLHRRGVPVALGTDWILTGSMSMARELACADDYNRRYLAGRLSDRELFEAAAANAALAGGAVAANQIGGLAPGRLADVVVFGRDGREPYRAAIEGDVNRIALVLRAGRPLLGEDDVLALWPTASCADASVTFCGRALRPCLQGEFGLTHAQLALQNAGSYPDHACGIPADEPPCLPARPLVSGGFPVHDGVPKAGDFDGDGYANGVDLCPVIFDPPTVSPLAQPNADGDAAGDACDFCPTSVSATGCGEATATDLALVLAVPSTLIAEEPFAATLVASNTGAAAGSARAVLPTLRGLDDVSWTCAPAGGATCPANGTGGLDAAVVLPPGASVTFAIVATHPGPATGPGEAFVAVASLLPPSTQGESDSLDNYAADAASVLAGLFADGFESGDTSAWD